MTTDEIIKEFNSLPLEARKEIEDFMLFLRERYAKKNRSSLHESFNDDSFVGMWKDRIDLPDGEEWVREHRKEEWV